MWRVCFRGLPRDAVPFAAGHPYCFVVVLRQPPLGYGDSRRNWLQRMLAERCIGVGGGHQVPIEQVARCAGCVSWSSPCRRVSLAADNPGPLTRHSSPLTTNHEPRTTNHSSPSLKCPPF